VYGDVIEPLRPGCEVFVTSDVAKDSRNKHRSRHPGHPTMEQQQKINNNIGYAVIEHFSKKLIKTSTTNNGNNESLDLIHLVQGSTATPKDDNRSSDRSSNRSSRSDRSNRSNRSNGSGSANSGVMLPVHRFTTKVSNVHPITQIARTCPSSEGSKCIVNSFINIIEQEETKRIESVLNQRTKKEIQNGTEKNTIDVTQTNDTNGTKETKDENNKKENTENKNSSEKWKKNCYPPISSEMKLIDSLSLLHSLNATSRLVKEEHSTTTSLLSKPHLLNIIMRRAVDVEDNDKEKKKEEKKNQNDEEEEEEDIENVPDVLSYGMESISVLESILEECHERWYSSIRESSISALASNNVKILNRTKPPSDQFSRGAASTNGFVLYESLPPIPFEQALKECLRSCVPHQRDPSLKKNTIKSLIYVLGRVLIDISLHINLEDLKEKEKGKKKNSNIEIDHKVVSNAVEQYCLINNMPQLVKQAKEYGKTRLQQTEYEKVNDQWEKLDLYIKSYICAVVQHKKEENKNATTSSTSTVVSESSMAEVVILSGEWKGKWVKCQILSAGKPDSKTKAKTFNIHVVPTTEFSNAAGYSDTDVPNVSVKHLRPVTTSSTNSATAFVTPVTPPSKKIRTKSMAKSMEEYEKIASESKNMTSQQMIQAMLELDTNSSDDEPPPPARNSGNGGKGSIQVRASCVRYMIGVLSYFATEILSCSWECTETHGRSSMSLEDIRTTILEDDELKFMNVRECLEIGFKGKLKLEQKIILRKKKKLKKKLSPNNLHLLSQDIQMKHTLKSLTKVIKITLKCCVSWTT